MSGFEKLRDVSNNFANYLRQTSLSFSVVTAGKTDDAITKKTQHLKLLSAKLKLLQAHPLSLIPQIANQPHDNALEEYGDTVASKLIESVTVNSLTTARAVQALVCTPDEKLDQEMKLRKKAIIKSLSQYHSKEMQLSTRMSIMQDKEAECAELRMQWDKTLTALKSLPDQGNGNEEGDRGPLLKRLKTLIDKLELMRWLIGQMVCAPTNYDWISDPDGRISVLALTRQNHTVDMFTQD